MTTVSRADLESGIRALGDSLVTQIDIVGGDAAFTPELSFGEITNGQHPYNFDNLHMSVTGHVAGVPDAIRKKFQTKFRRNNKPSWGYYRRNKDVAFASPYRLPSGAWAVLSLYDYRCSRDVEFVLTALEHTASDIEARLSDHDFIESPCVSRDGDDIKEAVKRWIEIDGSRHYRAVAVWQNFWSGIRIGQLNSYNFNCLTVESPSIGDDGEARSCIESVCAGLMEAGMRFRLFDSDWMKASSLPVEGKDEGPLDMDDYKYNDEI